MVFASLKLKAIVVFSSNPAIMLVGIIIGVSNSSVSAI